MAQPIDQHAPAEGQAPRDAFVICAVRDWPILTRLRLDGKRG